MSGNPHQLLITADISLGSSRVMARSARRVQDVFKISRVGSDWVGSDKEVVKISRTGAIHPDPTRPHPRGST